METYETSGASQPFWLDKNSLQFFSSLEDDVAADVCIIGAGISGLTCALNLLEEGFSVIILEDGPVCGGETCRTTGHLAFALDDRYYELEKFFGTDGAALTAQSHQAAVDFVEKFVKEQKVSCNFERLDAYLFAPPKESLDELRKEIEACHRIGLDDVEWVNKAPWKTFDTGPALKFPRQGEFSPLPYLEALTKKIVQKGGKIYTNTHAAKVESGSPCHVITSNGMQVESNQVIVASNSPINTTVTIHTKQAQYRTYVIMAKVPEGYIEKALYYDTPDPYHYIRLVENRNGVWMMVGGEDHRTGEEKHPEDCFDKLESWTKMRFPAFEKVEYRWSGQIIEPIDSLAFIGKCPGEKNVFVVTGDSGNGLTHGTIAGMLLPDLIVGRQNPWEKIYDPARVTIKAAPEFIEENANTAWQYRDWLTFDERRKVDEIPKGSGIILHKDFKKYAIYREENGQLHVMSAVCPHLKGVVRWNECEKSWDCPCHGSRFNTFGKVVNGPSNKDLEEEKI